MSAVREIDYRQTFLRWHIDAELAQTGDVLAIAELRRDVRTQAHSDPAELDWHDEKAALRRFFYDDLSGMRLYIPVRVKPIRERRPEVRWNEVFWDFAHEERMQQDSEKDGSRPGIPRTRETLWELSELIVQLRRRPERTLEPAHRELPPGIVLTTRSGAGKTVACRKAFCDTFWKLPSLSSPLLAGYLPCWLPRHDLPQFANARKATARRPSRLPAFLKSVGAEVVQELILRAATVVRDKPVCKASLSQMSDWLALGPPLLVFVDLNTFGEVERKVLAASLARYQAAYPTHCCVVTYRDLGPDDETQGILQSAMMASHKPAYGFYDLEPVHPEQAVHYVKAFRNTRERVRGTASVPGRTEEDVEGACDLLRGMIERYVTRQPSKSGSAGRTGTAAEESVLSTPLLMHFVGVLDDSALGQLLGGVGRREIPTLAGLYDAVVTKHLERDYRTHGDKLAGLSKDDVRVAMTRVALVLQAWGRTRLTHKELQNILQDPEYTGKQNVGEERPAWWPQRRYWRGAKKNPVAYYRQKFLGSGAIEQVIEFALLRRDSAGIGFLHDSLIYYFAGVVGLRYWQGPGQPPAVDGRWSHEVTRRLATDQQSWALPAEFVGGTLDEEEFQLLAVEFVVHDPSSELPDYCFPFAGEEKKRLW